jgi:type II secretory pathway pseudopilin PulG
MRKSHHQGFSLIETLVAAGLLATATVTVCTLGAKSLSSLRVHQEYEKAWDILDRQMVLIEQIGVQTLVNNPNASGVINDQQSGQQWRWQAEVEPLEIENLYSLSMTLEWVSDYTTRRIQCDTRLRAASEIVPTDSGSSSSSSTTPATTGSSSGSTTGTTSGATQ